MPRVPYEVVAQEAERIIVRMVLAPSWEQAYYYWDLYTTFIESCGWTNQEFDRETIKRIDRAWELFPLRKWN